MKHILQLWDANHSDYQKSPHNLWLLLMRFLALISEQLSLVNITRQTRPQDQELFGVGLRSLSNFLFKANAITECVRPWCGTSQRTACLQWRMAELEQSPTGQDHKSQTRFPYTTPSPKEINLVLRPASARKHIHSLSLKLSQQHFLLPHLLSFSWKAESFVR